MPLGRGPNKGKGKIDPRLSAAPARLCPEVLHHDEQMISTPATGLEYVLLRTSAQDSGRLGAKRLLECRQQGYRRLL
jgi:hypothetical protein